jgi:hypothetical protein
MYYVLARDSKGNVSVMGEPVDEDEAREHEEQLTNAYPAFHIWIERAELKERELGNITATEIEELS